MGFLNKIFTYEYITKEHLTGFDKYKVNFSLYTVSNFLKKKSNILNSIVV
jgi:hypothetical protein